MLDEGFLGAVSAKPGTSARAGSDRVDSCNGGGVGGWLLNGLSSMLASMVSLFQSGRGEEDWGKRFAGREWQGLVA